MTDKCNSITAKVWKNVAGDPSGIAAVVRYEGNNPYAYSNSLSRVTGRLAQHKPALRPNTVSVTWEEYGHMVAEATLFLKSAGLKKVDGQHGDRVAILGWDSLEWMAFNRAAHGLGLIVVPLYPNSTPDQVAHILNDSGPALIVSESVDLQQAMVNFKLVQSGPIPTVLFDEVFKHVPSFSGKSASWDGVPRPYNFRFEATAEYNRLLKQFTDDEAKLPFAPDDVCTLIYTSGSTALPKGAMILHRNIRSSCELLSGLGFDFGPQDLIMHFLPFAHIYGNANGKDLAESKKVPSCSAKPQELKTELPANDPSVLLCVPRLLNRYKSEIEKEAVLISYGPFFSELKKRAVAFDLIETLTFPFLYLWSVLTTVPKNGKKRILAWGLKQNKPGFKQYLARKLVFRGIKKKIGMSRVRMIASGSAACPQETIDFFDMLGLPICEGYGLTETTGGIFGNTLGHRKPGSLGRPGPGVEWRLAPREGIDVEPNTGILWVRGDMVFGGYWNNEEKTREAFDAEGWFCTGDIVHMDEDGFGWYRGRAKRQKKLDTGEWYSEDSIETALTAAGIIGAAVATGEQRSCVGALIAPDLDAAKVIVGKAPEGVDRYAYYCNHAEVRAAVQKAVDDGNKALLVGEASKKWEQVWKWDFLPEEPTIANGLLTPTLKIKNEEVLKRYPDLIAAMYARGK